MRIVTFALVALLVVIQYPLWLGKGGWLRVWEVERQLAQQQQVNAGLLARNRSLEAEVHDLQQGTGAIEERARYELGLIKPDEIFVQLAEPGEPAPMPTIPTALSAAPSSPGRLVR